ncbi:hypothetical protein F4824DRAFT_30139 [Ustulina deusta]|nr:hypothetical protein F4824DRAFT_30139 [Ustulina deusta]
MVRHYGTLMLVVPGSLKLGTFCRIPTATGNNVPSGLAVRWSHSDRSSADCLLEELARVPVDPRTLRPAFDLANGYVPHNVYGNDGRFAALGVSERLMQIQLYGLFANEVTALSPRTAWATDPASAARCGAASRRPRRPILSPGGPCVQHPDF